MGDSTSIWVRLRGAVPGGGAEEQRTCLKAALAPAQRREKNASEKDAREREQYVNHLETRLRDQAGRKSIEQRVQEQQLVARAKAAEADRMEAMRKRRRAEAKTAKDAEDAAARECENAELRKLASLLQKKEGELAEVRKSYNKLEQKYMKAQDAKQLLSAVNKSNVQQAKQSTKQLIEEKATISAEAAAKTEAEALAQQELLRLEGEMQEYQEGIERLGSELAVLHQWQQENRPARAGAVGSPRPSAR